MDFPANNQASRAQVRPSIETPTEKESEVKKVVSGTVSRRKKPLGTRLAETFIGGDAKSALTYVVFEVLIPAAKDTIADMISGGTERILYDNVRSASRRASSRPSGSTGFINYNRFGRAADPRREDPRQVGSNRRSPIYDFQDILVETRPEAEEVIEQMVELINVYKQATVEDLYRLVGITPEYTDQKWGWTDFRGAKVVWTRGAYLLDLPRPEQLER